MFWNTTPYLLATICYLLAPALVQAQTIAYGDSVALGNGMVTTWVEVDADHAPLRIGVTLTAGVLSGLPHTMREYSLELPRIAADSLFQHVLFDWMPHGHSPSNLYAVPHFDFHFYTISRQERETIYGGYDPTPIPPKYMPQDYIPVPGLGTFSVPQMGVHYADSYAPELNGEPFSRTLIYGFFQGKMIFVEPMITRAHLLSQVEDSLAIKQPQMYQQSGYYPTVYQIRHDADRGAIDVFITGFVWRDAATISSEDPAAVPAIQLAQSYPNPFSGSTTIDFVIPSPGPVLLEVFDMLGRRVAVLVDEHRSEGSHAVSWNPAGLSSGLYQYRLTTPWGTLARAVMLVD